MFIESGETFKWRLRFCGYISGFPSLKDADKPPIVVAVIHQKEAVATDDIRLSVYGCGETGGGQDRLVMCGEGERPAGFASVSSSITEGSSSSVQVAVAACIYTRCLDVAWAQALLRFPLRKICFQVEDSTFNVGNDEYYISLWTWTMSAFTCHTRFI